MATPRFKEVPTEWKRPLGPYEQAPPDFGGEWWLVNPFTAPKGVKPWELAGKPLASEPPADYVRVFGPRPALGDRFRGEWDDNLEAWKGVGLPSWLTQPQVDEANKTFRAWGMGAGVVYQGAYGWSVRFPETGRYEFEAEARSAFITSTHWKVAEYQDFLRNRGEAVPKPHPFLPPGIK